MPTATRKASPRRAAARPPSTLTGYVLHQHDWSESSLIVDAFTRELGRVVLVARGAKRPHSQLRPVLLPFQRLQLVIGRVAAVQPTQGEAMPELHNLRHAEWAGTHPQPRGAALFSGFYLHELLRALLARHDPHPVLFDAYAEALAWLAGSDEVLHAAVLRAFELRLLREIGLLPALDVETVSGDTVLEQGRYRLSPELGLHRIADVRPTSRAQALAQAEAEADEQALAPPRSPLPSDGLPMLNGGRLLGLHAALDGEWGDDPDGAAAVDGSPRIDAAPRRLAPLVLACQDGDIDLKPLLRTLLHYHLGGTPLRTRALMRDLQSLQSEPGSPPS